MNISLEILSSSDDGDIRLTHHVDKVPNFISDNNEASTILVELKQLYRVFFTTFLNNAQRSPNNLFKYFVTHVSDYSILVAVQKLKDPKQINNDGNKEPV